MTTVTWDEWFNALKAFIADKKVAAQWARRSGDVVHSLESIARDIKDWQLKNPPPPHPRRPPPPKPPRLPGAGAAAVDIAKLQHDQRVYNQVGHAGNMIRIGRKTEQGGSFLLALAALGGGSLVFIGACVVKFAVENLLWDMGERAVGKAWTAIQEAVIPATMQQAESQYQAYLWNIQATRARFGPNILHVIPRDEWLWQEYQVRWDALRP